MIHLLISKLTFVKYPLGGVTTDYFDYVILIKNSEVATSFGQKD